MAGSMGSIVQYAPVRYGRRRVRSQVGGAFGSRLKRFGRKVGRAFRSPLARKIGQKALEVGKFGLRTFVNVKTGNVEGAIDDAIGTAGSIIGGTKAKQVKKVAKSVKKVTDDKLLRDVAKAAGQSKKRSETSKALKRVVDHAASRASKGVTKAPPPKKSTPAKSAKPAPSKPTPSKGASAPRAKPKGPRPPASKGNPFPFGSVASHGGAAKLSEGLKATPAVGASDINPATGEQFGFGCTKTAARVVDQVVNEKPNARTRSASEVREVDPMDLLFPNPTSKRQAMRAC